MAYANRAMALLKQAKYQQAEADCTAALEVTPPALAAPEPQTQSAWLQIRPGGVPNRRGNVLGCGLQLDPEYVKALSRRGTARRHLGMYLDSTLDFELAVRLEPTSSLHTKERCVQPPSPTRQWSTYRCPSRRMRHRRRRYGRSLDG